MATMNQSEQIAALTSLVVKLHRQHGEAARLRLAAFGSTDSVSPLAKLCGTTPEVVRAWETGALEPTTTQALQWLTTLYAHDAYGVRRRP